MGLINLPGDDFLKGTVGIAEQANGIGVAMKPSDVGMTHQGIRPRIRAAGAKLGLTGLIEGIAQEGIDKHVTPFLVDRITDAANGLVSLTRQPDKLIQATANVNPYGFGGGF